MSTRKKSFLSQKSVDKELKTYFGKKNLRDPQVAQQAFHRTMHSSRVEIIHETNEYINECSHNKYKFFTAVYTTKNLSTLCT